MHSNFFELIIIIEEKKKFILTEERKETMKIYQKSEKRIENKTKIYKKQN